MNKDLTQGPVMRSMLLFAVPMILGNLLQQCYNVADTLIVSWYLGPDALAAVGSAFTLMTFLTSILLGLCMGSGAVFSIRFGQRDEGALRESARAAFVLIAALTVVLNILTFLCLDGIQVFLRVSDEAIWALMREYLAVIFWGIAGTFLYNYFACYLRAVGDSVTPLIFLAVSALLNIGLDLWFVIGLRRGVAGAAEATVISQYVSGLGLGLSPRVSRALMPLMTGLNGLPKLALGPLFIIWFGMGLSSKVLISALMVFFIFAFNLYTGVQSVDPALVGAVRLLGGTQGQILGKVIWPACLPWLLTSLRTGLGLSLSGAIVGEYLGSTRGMGWLLSAAGDVFNAQRVLCCVLILVILIILLDGVVRLLEARLLRWR